jgi:hypothetical protein
MRQGLSPPVRFAPFVVSSYSSRVCAVDREAACAARAGLSHRDVLTWVFHVGRAVGLLWGALYLLVSVFVLWLFRTGVWPAQWAVGQ